MDVNATKQLLGYPAILPNRRSKFYLKYQHAKRKEQHAALSPSRSADSMTMRGVILLVVCIVQVSAFFQGLLGAKSKPGLSPRTLQESIVDLSKGNDNGIRVSSTDKATILDYVKQLEAQNPSKVIGSNSKMTGAWELIYTSNSGSSAGKLGPFVGKVVQDINIAAKSYTNYAIFGNGLLEASLVATWDDVNPKLWRVRFQTLRFKLAGIQVAEKSLEGSVGIWRMTYLDDNLRILYAKGKEDASAIENIYILGK